MDDDLVVPPFMETPIYMYIPIGSMYAIYGNIHHQYIPVMLASIYHTWIPWDIYIYIHTYTQVLGGYSGCQYDGSIVGLVRESGFRCFQLRKLSRGELHVRLLLTGLCGSGALNGPFGESAILVQILFGFLKNIGIWMAVLSQTLRIFFALFTSNLAF